MFRRLLFALILTASAAQATSYPLTVTDDLGRSVTLLLAPKRIVAMLSSHTDTDSG